MSTFTSSEIDQFIESYNLEYLAKHRSYENNFWETKMNKKDCSSSALTKTKADLDLFLGDSARLHLVRNYLQSDALSEEQAKVLKIFEKTMLCYIIEDPKVMEQKNKINELEAELGSKRNQMALGYINPETNEKVAASSVLLRNVMRTSENPHSTQLN